MRYERDAKQALRKSGAAKGEGPALRRNREASKNPGKTPFHERNPLPSPHFLPLE